MTLLPDAERTRTETAPVDRIRTAAMRSFATHGFANTSLRAVASTAGVSLGLVQHHFATKAGLIKAVDDYVLTVVLTRITEEVPASASDSVAEIGDRVTRMIAELPDIVDYVGRALIDSRPVGYMVFDALLNSGTARWNQRGERGETRPDLDLTWAAVNSLVLALGTFILRGHIERNLPQPLTSPEQLRRWQASVTMLLREGLFKQPE